MAIAATPRVTIFRRPSATHGLAGWLTTVDHKRIGVLYGVTAFVFFLLGGIEALLLRIQLAGPNGQFLSAEEYNQLFTMHGTTMIFLVVMPLSAAFFNYLVPLQIGARDVAFPRLNAFSYWVFLLGGVFLYSSFFLGGAPAGGWFAYAPLSEELAGNGMDFYALGLQILGVASLASAVNFIVTILNERAPGMSLMRLPVFTWMTLVVSFLLLFAMPVIAIALFQLGADRILGATFFNPTAGGDPILWQHMFWLFGHPEVYILILPAMGIVSEVLPTFSRKPLFGYAAVVFSGIAIGFMGWGVWAHHMFTVGLGPIANAAFALSTMFIAVPTGVKIFNWLGTLWGGAIRFATPMLFSLGFVAMFIIGGLSGVTHAIVPSDYQQQDTYYIVAHFHYVLFGGSIFGLFSGAYYWWPKVTGRMYDERLGKLHFWLMLIGFNLTFGPFHILGLQGMPRRIDTYPAGMGWEMWNFVSTVGAFMIAASILTFMVNAVWSAARGRKAEGDPWDARTLEWSIPSPPPHYNFAEIPLVHARDDLWHRKYSEDRSGRPVPVVAGAAATEHDAGGHGDEEEGHAIHMPDPSYFPLVAAAGLPLMGYGLIFHWSIAVLGLLLTLGGLFGWSLEPVAEEGAH
ncbi:MAG TPA: cytochrome c oxidase subunit I [Actinomycetota bacterium]|nr:cytochrome c oxidase subunit I [Actinomycetota bacterium]